MVPSKEKCILNVVIEPWYVMESHPVKYLLGAGLHLTTSTSEPQSPLPSPAKEEFRRVNFTDSHFIKVIDKIIFVFFNWWFFSLH